MLHPPLLITAGPTFEDIDQVRFLGNRSSGRLGLCLAAVAAARGWETTIAVGPISRPVDLPSSVRVLR
ncbi:MAG: phosphopantothenoylcysteine decarboxylase, partial [Phycisphaerales bacterium JB038]